MNSSFKKIDFTTILFILLILFFSTCWFYAKFFMLHPLQKNLSANIAVLNSLEEAQAGQSSLLEKISKYRDGLYGLNLILEARKEIIKGEDPDNPYLIFDISQLLTDLKTLLPKDARATKFQITPKGLITLPIESVDYASLGRVLKSFKDKTSAVSNDESKNSSPPAMFSYVMVPAGAQRNFVKTPNGRQEQITSRYSFILQAQLNPEYWKNPMPYPDVEANASYGQAVLELSQVGLIEGYPDGYFKPLEPINRAEFFKIALAEFLDRKVISQKEYELYSNPSIEGWEARYLHFADEMGLESKDKQVSFTPDQNVSRIEALKTILTIFNNNNPIVLELRNNEGKKYESIPFTDVGQDKEHFELIKTANEKGMFKDADQKFEPDAPVSRAEVAYWIWKIKFKS